MEAGLRIEVAGPADDAAILAIRRATWPATYAGLVPDDVIDTVRDADALPPPSPGLVGHIARRDGMALGYIATGPARDAVDPYRGEVYAIYVRPEEQGTGVGRALFAFGVARLRRDGMAPFWLWVLAGNRRARGFYEAAGGARLEMEDCFTFRGQRYPHIPILGYGWS